MTTTAPEEPTTAPEPAAAPTRRTAKKSPGRRAGAKKTTARTVTATPRATATSGRGASSYSQPIRDLFTSRPGQVITIAEVAEHIGQDRAAVGMGLSALARRGVLERVGTGQYRLAGTPGGPAPRRARKSAATTERATRGGRRSARKTSTEAPANGASTSPTSAVVPSTGDLQSMQAVFTLVDGEVILQDAEGTLWQAHRVQLVAQ
jgi:hypothetical protein